MASSSHSRQREDDEGLHRSKTRHPSRRNEERSHHRHQHREDRKRDRSRSRSPSSSHRRHHHSRGEDKEESREERKERKRKERDEDERDKKHRSSDKDARYYGKEGHRNEATHSRIIHDSKTDQETFADSDPSLFEDTTSQIPSSDSLALQSNPNSSRQSTSAILPKEPPTVSSMKRDDWMLTGSDVVEVSSGEPQSEGATTTSPDYFSNLGSYSRQRAPKEDKPNPDQLKISSREINTQFIQGKHIDDYEKVTVSTSKPGGAGHQWRMMKLRRVYEAAEDEGRSVEEVALERYGSMEAFNEARVERQYLDDQQGRRKSTMNSPGSSRPPSRPMSRQSFKRPGESSSTTPFTPQAKQPPTFKQNPSFKQSGYDSDGSSKPMTPIPSVFTPTMTRAGSKLRDSDDNEKEPVDSSKLSQAIVASQSDVSNSNPPLSAAALNKLSAKVLRAEMMGSGDAVELRSQFERENARAQSIGDHSFGTNVSHQIGGQETLKENENHIQVLPSLDARGRLYDVGKSKAGEADEKANLPGNRKRSNGKFETRDSKTGDLIRYNPDDDDHTLADLVRQERFGAGSADQKNVDAEMAIRISNDQAFKDNIDYMDDNVERLARKKMKSDAMKRQFAVQDFAKTKKALDSCQYCWQEEGAKPPRAAVISSGTRSYLALPSTEPLTLGHCVIVPMQHHLSTLEADDDCWEEIKNFMKCLMQMAASHKQGVVFFETVKSLKQQRHTFIEAVPVDASLFQELPGYFKQSIMTTGDEWSQNKKLIEFSSSRSFRRAMVPQLPYFMIQWDYKGEKGYGHVIEDGDGFDGAGSGGGDGFELTEGSKGGGDFPHWFAAEIIGSLLELEPRRWRKPRRLHRADQEAQMATFQQRWKPFDWTHMIGQAEQQP